MRARRRLASALSLLLLVGLLPPAARATIDQPAALLVFPYIRVDPAEGIDTVIQIANTSDAETHVRCFLENANSHCQPSGTICQPTAQCANGEICVAGWEVTSFLLTLTARQPIGWEAGAGRAEPPLPENGDGIPAVPEQPFSGALRCIVVDPNGVPLGANSLIGRAQIKNVVLDDVVDAGSYNAVGFLAGSVDDDGELILAPDGEYSPAASVVQLQFLYDGVADPLAGEGIHETTLVAVPASVDYATPASKPTTVQVAVFNEFETRLSTSFQIPAQLSRRISLLDSPNPAVSIFSVRIGGTVSGQMRLSVGGIVALAVDRRVDAEGVLIASVIRQPNALGMRQTADRIALVVPPTPTPPSMPTFTSTGTATRTATSTPAETETVAPTPSLTPTHSPSTPPTPSPMPTHTEIASPTQNATPTHTHTFSPTASATPTHAETTSPTPSSTPVQTNTVSPTPSVALTHTETVAPSPTETPPPCLGDCDGSGQVTVDELLKMVAIALGLQDVGFCRNGDRGDGLITVDEIVNAVQHALNSC